MISTPAVLCTVLPPAYWPQQLASEPEPPLEDQTWTAWSQNRDQLLNPLEPPSKRSQTTAAREKTSNPFTRQRAQQHRDEAHNHETTASESTVDITPVTTRDRSASIASGTHATPDVPTRDSFTTRAQSHPEVDSEPKLEIFRFAGSPIILHRRRRRYVLEFTVTHLTAANGDLRIDRTTTTRTWVSIREFENLRGVDDDPFVEEGV